MFINALSYERRTTRAVTDLIVILAITVITFVLASSIDGFEMLAEWFEKSSLAEQIQLDELFVAFIITGVGFVIFATRRWSELTAEIAWRKQAEETLRQRSTELEKRNEELDAFAHTVAHDIRNPLTNIISYADILEQDYDVIPDAEAKGFLQTIARNTHKLDRILDELLVLAEVRKTDVALVPLDMASIVNNTRQRLAHMIAEHQAEIVAPAEWPVALGYAPWVEEVLANYVSNAIVYGGRPPRVELGAETQPGNTVRFWVRDNGSGIAPEDQAKLFTPFTRLAQTRAKGHGLGLSIVRRIIERLGGQVRVESVVGQGSVFSFTLPAAQ